MHFVNVPSGTFWKGGSGGKRSSDQVQATVQPTVQSFQLGVYEVTQGQWQLLMEDNPSCFSRGKVGSDAVAKIPDAELYQNPVENVSWDDIKEFMKRLNYKEKNSRYTYRLPTEDEWEFACRGGATSQEDCSFDFYFEDDKPSIDLAADKANFNGNFPLGNAPKMKSLGRPTKVGSYPANALGIYDMHGNVWEWCDDLYNGGPNRVSRGGGWGNRAMHCRATTRNWNPPESRDYDLGFRVARVPSSNAAVTSTNRAEVLADLETNLKAAKDKDQDVRQKAAGGLAKLLKDQDEVIRRKVALALSEMGLDAEPASVALNEAGNDTDEAVRMMARGALKKLEDALAARKAAKVQEALEPLLRRGMTQAGKICGAISTGIVLAGIALALVFVLIYVVMMFAFCGLFSGLAGLAGLPVLPPHVH
jgi:formylglycine-generating enzyme required for sulfatase activity